MPAGDVYSTLAGITDPFPGLRPFESDEEPIFRGRQHNSDELLRKLAAHRFLALVGTSGSGKSSLVRAGLMPALDRGYLAGATSRWRIAMMRPGMAPLENLAEALRDKEALGAADVRKLRSSSLGLIEAVHEARLTPGESLLVVADQFEELFRYQQYMFDIDGGAEAAMFVNLLLTAVARPDVPVYVVLTMRSDFLGDCAKFSGLPEALSENQYLIPRLTRQQRRQAIEEPLRLFGATMTAQLVEQLLNDSGEEVIESGAASRYRGGALDTLPVLQHALMRTYLVWKSLPPDKAVPHIDLAHYRDAGRMNAALDQHAESTFMGELDDAGRLWAERIFRCLTTTEFGHPVRRPTPLADLYRVIGARKDDQPRIDRVLEICGRRENSFLQVNKDGSVDISHESLIWKWKRLNGWLAREAASAELYRDLVKDASAQATWGEPKLSSAVKVRNQDGWNADWARQYSEASFDEVERFLARSRKVASKQRLLRWFGLTATAALLILSVAVYDSRQDLAVMKLTKESLETEVASRQQHEKALQDQITALDAQTGATKQEQDSIRNERTDLAAQLRKSQQDTDKLKTQAERSTDLLASVKSLQSQIDALRRERDMAEQARRAAVSQPTAIPNPVLSLTGTERYSANGRKWIRYKYDVLNKADFPAELFVVAPALPPCGKNNRASRTWVDFYDQGGKRLYGFCALGKPDDLSSISFGLEDGVVPPSDVYIEMTDRLTNTKYKSNLAKTTF